MATHVDPKINHTAASNFLGTDLIRIEDAANLNYTEYQSVRCAITRSMISDGPWSENLISVVYSVVLTLRRRRRLVLRKFKTSFIYGAHNVADGTTPQYPATDFNWQIYSHNDIDTQSNSGPGSTLEHTFTGGIQDYHYANFPMVPVDTIGISNDDLLTGRVFRLDICIRNDNTGSIPVCDLSLDAIFCVEVI